MIAAWLEDGAAVLRFPYEEHRKTLLRAIPGRRWHPTERVWRVPLTPESAQSVSFWLGFDAAAVEIDEELARALARYERERDGVACVIDLVRFDHDQWFTFCADAAPGLRARLLEHPRAIVLEEIGRALLPADGPGIELIGLVALAETSVALSPQVQRAAEEPIATGGSASGPLRLAWPTPPNPPRANISVGGARGAPMFLLDRDPPPAVRARAQEHAGGWMLPLDDLGWSLIREHMSVWLTYAARRCVDALERGEVPPTAVLERSAVHLQPTFVLAPGCVTGLPERFATLDGAMAPHARYATAAVHEHASLPSIRIDPFCVPALDGFLGEHCVLAAPGALDDLQEIREQHALAAGTVELSRATHGTLEVAGLGGELKPFQRAGVAYLLERRRAFLADEQGLGKTIEAIAAIEHDGAYPAIVVCPASLKLNWRRELEHWIPHRTVEVLDGRHPDASTDAADVTVLNYDIVRARLPALAALAPRALVLDESHYCKNASAQRTKAVAALAARVHADGLVFALSGTPVMNRAPELIAQLRILGRLAEFGSGRAFGERFRGADAHLRLHWHLRARGFVRRLKVEVLPQLPAKTRAVVPIALDNEPEYRLAEQDLVAWLRTQPLDLRELDARVASALRAERLVRLGALALIAARGKLRAATAWIHDFLSSGERLVVFASHREVQRVLVARFPDALHLLGGDDAGARSRALDAFQAPDGPGNQLIICSLAVAGQGITLTRASNVAFLELAWTPATHDQAEDRCHRIGQDAAVTAWYLLAADTIDETTARLLERKRVLVEAVTDGRSQSEEAVLDALVRDLRERPFRHLRAVS